MQVIVSCPLIVPDEPIDRNALEAHIQAWGRALRALAFQQCWQQYQAHAPACPRCQQPTTVAAGSRPYALRTLFGTVRLARQQRRCRACGRRFQPLDPLLGAGSGRATTGLCQAAMLAAAWLLHALSGAGRRRDPLPGGYGPRRRRAAGRAADGAGARAHRPGWGLRPEP